MLPRTKQPRAVFGLVAQFGGIQLALGNHRWKSAENVALMPSVAERSFYISAYAETVTKHKLHIVS